MPTIPGSLKIGPITYKVILADALEDEETKQRLFGEIDYERRTIALADGESQNECASLVHELTHALLEVTGIDLSESRVNALAYALFGCFRDNPDLFPGWQELK